MAVLLWVVLLLAMTGHSSGSYCLCKSDAITTALQKALDYACGAGADCSPILQNGVCYSPNTVKAHCDYAVNSYYQKNPTNPQNCNFSGTATVSNIPPSTAVGSCVFPSGSSTTGTPTTTVPSTNTPGSTTTTSPTTPGTTTTTTPGTTTTTPVFNNGNAGLGPSSGFGTDTSGAVTTTAKGFLRNPNWVCFLGLALWLSGLALVW